MSNVNSQDPNYVWINASTLFHLQILKNKFFSCHGPTNVTIEQQDIVRFQITVEHVLRMHVLDGGKHLLEDASILMARQGDPTIMERERIESFNVSFLVSESCEVQT